MVALSLAKQLETGNIAINDCLDQFSIIDAPFGGWKKSGLGVRHGPEGLLQFTRAKTTLIHSWVIPFLGPFFPKREFWWFPYEKKVESLLRSLIRTFFG